MRQGLFIGCSIAATAHIGMAQAAYNVVPAIQTTFDTVTQTRAHSKVLVTLVVRDSTAEYVVRTLAHQAHLRPVYNSDDPLLAKRVNVNVVNMDVMTALATVLKGTGLVAKLAPDGETVVIRSQEGTRETTHAQSDSGSIRGTVTDSATGAPITGATVTVQGTHVSAATSSDGEFVLNDVPIGEQAVVVKAFGYKPAQQLVTVTEGGRRPIGVVMRATATILSGVVTTATGVQSKLSVGSDITTINVDSVMQTAPVHTVTDLLENRVPGLTVVHTSGTPGDPSRLLLRGAASVNAGNNPIVVVDGVRIYDPGNLSGISYNNGTSPRPSPLDQIDPNTIATIEVLKGPSASALYGSDAANGVIVITTKRGQSGETHWSVSAMQGISYIPGSYPTLTYAFGHGAGLYQSEGQCIAAGQVVYSGMSVPCSIDSVRSFQALNDPRFSPLTSGPQSSVSTTVSGGASALTYSFTGSAQNTHGMTKLPSFIVDQYTNAVGAPPPSWMRHPDDYLGWNGSGQVQAQLSPQATLVVSNLVSSSTQHRTDLGLDAVGQLLDVYVDTSNFGNTPALTYFTHQITQATLTSTSAATLNWRIRPWLPLMVTGGYNRTQENDKAYEPAGLPAALFSLANDADTSGRYNLNLLQATNATLNANTTIPLQFSRGRALQLALGMNFVSQSTSAQQLYTYQVPVGVSDPTTFPSGNTDVYQTTQNSATYGWFMEPQLQLMSRLYITPGIRLDGGTASGSGAGVSAFPKTNVSYIALDRTGQTGETGWRNALTLLRLRGAFGIAGVEPTPGQSLRLFVTPSVVSLDGGVSSTTGTTISTVGNTLLHPERSREWETGFDAQFFQNRVSLTATYYDKLRIDAIQAITIAPSVYGTYGLNPVTTYANVGKIRNTGIEATADIMLFDRSAIRWNLNGDISSNSNRVLSTTGGYSDMCTDLYLVAAANDPVPCLRAGYPFGAVFAQPIVGAGDLNHDGVIESNEIFYGDSATYVGSPDPRYVATVSSNMAFWGGRLSFDVQGDYQSGLTILGSAASTLLGSAANQPNASTYTQVLGVGASSLGGNINNFGAQTVRQFRLDAVSLNIVLPNVVAHTFRAYQAILALQGSNLGLWSTYIGKDAGVGAVLNSVGSYDQGQLPLPRTWQLSVRITR